MRPILSSKTCSPLPTTHGLWR